MSSQASTAPEHPRQPVWPVLSGVVPLLVDAYVPRQESGRGVAGCLAPGQTMVLVPAADAANRSLGALGGTGKTQLAAAAAHTLWEQQAVDLLLWVSPTGRDAVITGYAQALAEVGEPVPGEGPEAAASAFLSWLAGTRRRWLAVLDDLSDPAVLDGLWPAGENGQVIVTSPRADTAAHALNPRAVEVGTFTAREAMAYLSTKLHADPDQWIGALDLAAELGFLPIALGQAGAVMAGMGIDCRQYRGQVAERKQRLTGASADTPPAIAAATWSLSAEVASRLSPANLARPALALLSVLDPGGIPGAVLTCPAACSYLTRARGTAPVDHAQARAALQNLARVGLVSIDTSTVTRTVRVHALVQATVWQNLSPRECEEAARGAAESLLEVWPPRDGPPDLEQALRGCAARLHAVAGKALWSPDCHPLLMRAGESLDDARLAGPGIAYWQSLMDIGRRVLGPAHAHTILARDHLAGAFEAAGRLENAIAMYERALTDREHHQGLDHPDTLASRRNLARAYRAAGRVNDGVRLAHRILAEYETTLGASHPDTLAARSDLAQAYLTAERFNEAVSTFQETLAKQERVLGPLHADTLSTRTHLALAYRAAGQVKDAIPLLARAVSDRERIAGPDHLDTITTRANLAAALRAGGRLKEAIPVYRHALADRERTSGPDHPDTITARGNLADAYHLANRLKEAIPLYERALADAERVLGPGHPDTITARGSLASAYHSGRRLAYALPLYERTLADCERVFGAGHPDTLTSRGNLAQAYYTAGRQTEALAVFQRTLADCEQALGPDHPLTRAIRENLAIVAQD